MGQQPLDYIEMPSKDLAADQQFFTQVFDWRFKPYGEDYLAFWQGFPGLKGGFYRSDSIAKSREGAPLMIFYSEALEVTLEQVLSASGVLAKAIFPFPGGRRFQFFAPGGVELGVWSDL
jgi:predicted enzyme related to lactoylglutathione lyase